MSVGHVHTPGHGHPGEKAIANGAGNFLRRGTVFTWNLTIAAVAVAAGYLFVGEHFGTSLAIGALVEAWNFRTLWRSCERIFLAEESVGLPVVAGFGMRFGLMAGFIALALWAGANAAGLVTGLSLIVPSVLIAVWRARPPVLADLPALEQDDPEWDEWNPWLARERTPDEDEEDDDLLGDDHFGDDRQDDEEPLQ